MPIAAGVTSVTPTAPTPPPVVTPRTPVRQPSPGVFTPVWYSPDGDSLQLNPEGSTFFTVNALTGIGIAPKEIITDPEPLGGVSVRDVRPRPRYITLPMRVRGTTHMSFLELWRDVADRFAQTDILGPGILEIVRPDGTARQIEAYYQSGFDSEPGQGWLEDTPVITLMCPDPFFRDAEPTVVLRSFETGSDYLSPYPMISAGSILGNTAIFNTGQANAYPSWVVMGPCSSLVATNQTTGQTFTISYALGVGEQITITTRPGSVVGPIGQNLADFLNWPVCELWPLIPGRNDVSFTLDGAVDGSFVELTFYQRYQTS